jgi:hypothetical protein
MRRNRRRAVQVRRGHRGDHVKKWQEFLIDQGHLPAGEADRRFGLKTEQATRSFQAIARIGTDGIVGPMTLAAAVARGFVEEYPHNPLTVRTANSLGLPVDLLSAFVLVESGGKPGAVRFEPHVAHRKLGARASVIPHTPQSARKRWSLVRAETSREAFDAAMEMNDDEDWKEAIVESSSFGLFQVLGGALLRLFPGPAVDAVRAFDDDPEIVSYALVADWFRRSPSAMAAAKADPPDIRTLVKRYNGPGNVISYSRKLTEALLRVRGLG